MRTEDDVKGLKLISVIEFDATSSINLKSCVTQDGRERCLCHVSKSNFGLV